MIAGGGGFNSLNPACIVAYNTALADVVGEYPFPDPAWGTAILRDDENRESVSAEINMSLVGADGVGGNDDGVDGGGGGGDVPTLDVTHQQHHCFNQIHHDQINLPPPTSSSQPLVASSCAAADTQVPSIPNTRLLRSASSPPPHPVVHTKKKKQPFLQKVPSPPPALRRTTRNKKPVSTTTATLPKKPFPPSSPTSVIQRANNHEAFTVLVAAGADAWL